MSAESPPSTDDLFIATALRRVRPIAFIALVATLLGRAIAPSIRGVGSEVWVRWFDRAGGISSQLLLIALIWLLLTITFAVLRVASLPVAFRIAATGLAGLVLGLATPASISRLSSEFSTALALGAVALAFLGAAQTIPAPHTRVLGVLLGMLGIAALTRQMSWLMAIHAGEHAWMTLARTARWTATVALAVQAIGLTFVLLWLATRRRSVATVWTSLATALALGAAFVAEHADRMASAPWKIALGRAVQRLVSPPTPMVPTGVRVFVAAVALGLAAAALLGRKEAPQLSGILALALLAGVDADVPLCALCLAVAALAGSITAHLEPRSPEVPPVSFATPSAPE